MATTKIWPVRDSLKRLVDYAGNPEKTEYTDLRQALHYAGQKEKTALGEEKAFLVSGLGCDPDKAYEQMMAVKQRFGKLSGNVAYHGYQSFKPGEVTPEQCHAIGLELAKRLWWPHYQVLVATHLDREHLHNHFLINSVSMVNGKKFNDDKRCYYEMRRVSDAICRERGLSVIEKPKGHTPRAIYFAEKQGEATKYNLMREAIDRALAVCSTPEDLRTELRRLGYEISSDPNRKYATLKRIGTSKATRLYRLGEDYDIPAMLKQIERNNYLYGRRMYEHFREEEEHKTCRPPAKQYRLRGSYRHVKKATGLQAVYLRFCFELGILPKHSSRQPFSPEMREECRRMESYSRQAVLIARERFHAPEDVERFLTEKQNEMDALTAARSKCYNRIRRCEDPEQLSEIRRERDGLTAQIAEVRREQKTAQEILRRHETMIELMKQEEAMRRERQAEPQRARQKERSYDYER